MYTHIYIHNIHKSLFNLKRKDMHRKLIIQREDCDDEKIRRSDARPNGLSNCMCYTSHVTRHTSHVTHVTRHTSHVTRRTHLN